MKVEPGNAASSSASVSAARESPSATAVERAALQAVERDGEIVEPAPTFHSLRHSHGSALIAAGWDIEEVSARLGHSNVGTTQRIYVHAYDVSRRSSARRDRLALLYGSDVEASPGSEEHQERAASDGGAVVQILEFGKGR